MRALKFKAWDGNKIRYDVTGFEHGKENEMGGIFLDGDYYSLVKSSTTSTIHGRHAVAMQFTGLTAKNGDEIYEGDIVYIAGKGDIEVKYDCCGYWSFGDGEDYQDVMEDIERVVDNICEQTKWRKGN